jgi:glutamate racemase
MAKNKKTDIIGVFDSGIGGLSILRELIKTLPNENFFYIADIAHSPYGEKHQDYILNRIEKISSYLTSHEKFNIKTLVVACNTATAYAIDLLRIQYPNISIVGVEPAIKPASKYTKTKKVGVLATYGTIHSKKFKELLNQQDNQVEFILQSCNDLAKSIDNRDLVLAEKLATKYISNLGCFGNQNNKIDSIVLGCTHYPLISNIIQNIVGEKIKLFDNAQPVAQQTKLVTNLNLDLKTGELYFASTAKPDILTQACQNFLGTQQESILLDI